MVLSSVSDILVIALFVFVAFVVAYILGIFMYHFVRPFHDKVWGYKVKRINNTKNAIYDGMLFLMLIFWLPLTLVIMALGVFLAVGSVADFNILGILLGIIVALVFGFQIYFMFEHSEKRKKRVKKKK
jgi:hypothetical protein